MSQIITTNLRLEEQDWLQIKAIAGELGMSVNKYINYLIAKVTTAQELGMVKDKKEARIWEELPKLAKLKNKPGKLNADDEVIYG